MNKQTYCKALLWRINRELIQNTLQSDQHKGKPHHLFRQGLILLSYVFVGLLIMPSASFILHKTEGVCGSLVLLSPWFSICSSLFAWDQLSKCCCFPGTHLRANKLIFCLPPSQLSNTQYSASAQRFTSTHWKNWLDLEYIWTSACLLSLNLLTPTQEHQVTLSVPII